MTPGENGKVEIGRRTEEGGSERRCGQVLDDQLLPCKRPRPCVAPWPAATRLAFFVAVPARFRESPEEDPDPREEDAEPYGRAPTQRHKRMHWIPPPTYINSHTPPERRQAFSSRNLWVQINTPPEKATAQAALKPRIPRSVATPCQSQLDQQVRITPAASPRP